MGFVSPPKFSLLSLHLHIAEIRVRRRGGGNGLIGLKKLNIRPVRLFGGLKKVESLSIGRVNFGNVGYFWSIRHRFAQRAGLEQFFAHTGRKDCVRLFLISRNQCVHFNEGRFSGRVKES